ncbi:MAG: redox-regulated ATPase YchF [Oscillospiraceae bacterium]|nr:redox-regulated ATPase YchF [Oscillospiraceae bacterium]
MKLGIVGLPNVGKSTLFNAITSAGAESANYPFCTIDPNVGMVNVPDPRLDELCKLYNPKKVTPAVVEFVDIAGLVKGASRGEGLGNQFLGHIRAVDAIVHVVRCFEDENIVHVDGSIDPMRDIETIELELVLSDLELLERRIDKTKKLLKGDPKLQGEVDLLERLHKHFEEGKPARSFERSEEEGEILKTIELLTAKPVIFAANLDESGESSFLGTLREYAESQGAQVFPICAKIECEIAELPKEERAEFLAELGMEQSGLDRLITLCYDLLGLISYLTAGEPEVRAWTITKGTRAPQAAGKIHSDFERGFIRAEVIRYEDLIECGSTAVARERGLMRSEGKEYVMQDGDVVLFRFNV